MKDPRGDTRTGDWLYGRELQRRGSRCGSLGEQRTPIQWIHGRMIRIVIELHRRSSLSVVLVAVVLVAVVLVAVVCCLQINNQ